jgi:polysaccharide export outer membrane protein
MKNLLKYILIVVVMSIFASCVTNKQTTLLQESNTLPDYESAVYEEYRLKIDDVLGVKVFSLDESITTLFNLGANSQGSNNRGVICRIYQDGTVDVPFADSIPVVGLTIQEATEVIENRLKPISDDISVKLNLENNCFYLIGSSGKGRITLYKDRMTIYQALAAGGFSATGSLKKVKIIREKNNLSEIIEFDLRTKSIIDSEYYYIQPNDIVYVERAKGSFFQLQTFGALTGFISSSLSFVLFMINQSSIIR